MIINDDEVAKRLNSPMNLINRLRTASPEKNKNSAMSLFGINKNQSSTGNGNGKGIAKETKTEEVKVSFNPFTKVGEDASQNSLEVIPIAPTTKLIGIPAKQEEPSVSDLLHNSDTQIKLSLAHDNALTLLNASVDALSAKLDEVSAAKLPGVITAASKVVESIRKERSEASKNNRDREVHYHFYTPTQKKVSDYEVIEVG